MCIYGILKSMVIAAAGDELGNFLHIVFIELVSFAF
jgi:hypothetical protein